jgi:hypothetical protein
VTRSLIAQLIRRRSSGSGLPDWIERGKEHAGRRLVEALAGGFRAMGDGLHVVEDHFSHSNFTEVALAQLVGEGAIRPDNPLVLGMGRCIGVDPARAGTDPLHRPLIRGSLPPGRSHGARRPSRRSA